MFCFGNSIEPVPPPCQCLRSWPMAARLFDTEVCAVERCVRLSVVNTVVPVDELAGRLARKLATSFARD